MVAEDSVWMYEPSFELSVFFTVVYSLIFLAITYLTFVKYRAWYFTPAVIGAVVEVVAYVARTYSAKNQSEIVCLSKSKLLQSDALLTFQGPLCSVPHVDSPCAGLHRRGQLHAHQPTDPCGLATLASPGAGNTRA